MANTKTKIKLDKDEKDRRIKAITDPLKLKKRDKVVKIIEERISNDDTCLPAIPSAQYWFKKMDKTDKKDFEWAVKESYRQSGEKDEDVIESLWQDYYTHMVQHWPQLTSRKIQEGKLRRF